MIKRSRYLLCLVSLIFPRLIFAQSVGGVASGAASYCDSLNSGFISLIGFIGNVLYWEESGDLQATWQQIQNTTSTQSYNQLNKTTSYRAIVQDGAFPPDTSTVATITVHVPGVAGSVSGTDTLCSGANSGTLTLSGTQGSVLHWQVRKAGGPWQNVSGTSYVLAYNNLTESGTYRAVVQRVPGCVADTSATEDLIVDETTIRGTLTGSNSFCYGSPGDTLTLSGQRGTFIEWIASNDEGQTWKTVQTGGLSYIYPQVIETTWYAVMVQNGVCSSDTTEPARVIAFAEVKAEAGPEMTITRRESVQLQGQGTSGTVRWNPSTALSDSTSLSPTATPIKTIVYTLTVTDINGCAVSDSVKITVEIPIPSAITPNGDGINDWFEIYEVEKFEKNSLNIYDRWGNLVFGASSYKNEFDGKATDGSRLPEDTYFYTFDFGDGTKPVSGYLMIKR